MHTEMTLMMEQARSRLCTHCGREEEEEEEEGYHYPAFWKKNKSVAFSK